MVALLLKTLGPWSWIVLGIVLLVFDIFAPGVFMLWIGIAALIVGALSLALWEASYWAWQTQVLLFLLLALISAYIGKRLMGARRQTGDQPLLNRRGEQMVGRTATLAEPIREGRGRIQLGDTFWRVSGPDLPAGARVRVIAATESDLELVVEAI